MTLSKAQRMALLDLVSDPHGGVISYERGIGWAGCDRRALWCIPGPTVRTLARLGLVERLHREQLEFLDSYQLTTPGRQLGEALLREVQQHEPELAAYLQRSHRQANVLPVVIHAYGARYVRAVAPCCDCLEGGDGEYLRSHEVDPQELALGVHEELIHTHDLAVAQQLALDHLAHDPHFYSRQRQQRARES